MTPVLNINLDNKVPKYLQIVNAIIDAIRKGQLKKGQRIFSINELSNEYFLSRDTVEKAYNILREQNVIIAVKGKGYYIKDVFIHIPLKVLLIFNKISNYKKQVYNAFIETIGSDAIVDLKIHHFNTQIFKSLIENHIDEYNYFVVMPHFYENQEEAFRIMRSIPADKLIILDKKVAFTDIKAAAVYQDFENDIVDALEQGLDLSNLYLIPVRLFVGFGTFVCKTIINMKSYMK